MAYSNRGMPMPFDFRNGRTDSDWTTGGKAAATTTVYDTVSGCVKTPFIHRDSVDPSQLQDIITAATTEAINGSRPLLMGDTRITMGIAAGGQGVGGRPEETQSYSGDLNHPREGRK
ncbi:hypothetical protein TcBrA4_0007670 [Trypanosoma cruzi]|nr:hypothetical protein TcBrA4_0007670 [Trypanosoma cruzi]